MRNEKYAAENQLILPELFREDYKKSDNLQINSCWGLEKLSLRTTHYELRIDMGE